MVAMRTDFIPSLQRVIRSPKNAVTAIAAAMACALCALACASACASTPDGLQPSPGAPSGLVALVGDRSVALHWQGRCDGLPEAYRVYRADDGSREFRCRTATPVAIPGWADVDVANGRTYRYRVGRVAPDGTEGARTPAVSARPRPLAKDADFLSLLQRTAFAYFWYQANPASGLIRDRSTADSKCSIAAVGFGLSAIGIGIDHGWITRAQGLARVSATLRTFLDGRQGPEAEGMIGHRGWFYHFLDMGTAQRAWRCELSSIDTALLLAGVLDARAFFNRPDPAERQIREHADALVERIDWRWMTAGEPTLRMGWHPESGFIASRWTGYSEAMILYLLGLGAEHDPLRPGSWQAWTASYAWRAGPGGEFVEFPPLFGHQYSHCWIDFRSVDDACLRARGTTYFENSRRATLAQRAYCIQNPGGLAGYGPDQWGLTASDGPKGYAARGAPPAFNDDGTLAPTAAGGAIAFVPELATRALRAFYDAHRDRLWTPFGFGDAFNLSANWWGRDALGIDQGPILIMIENHRTGRVWRRFMQTPEIRRGLERAGFEPVR
jgi:hypothetical protein